MLAKKIDFKKIDEDNGVLKVFQESEDVPFAVKRVFTVSTKKDSIRGNHAHKECHQFLICLKGKLKIDFDDGKDKGTEFIEENNNYGIYIPPLVWASQQSLKDENILLVIASDIFIESDYIRNKIAFLDYIKK